MKTRYRNEAEFLRDFNALVAERAQPAATSARKTITSPPPPAPRPTGLQHTPPAKIRRTS